MHHKAKFFFLMFLSLSCFICFCSQVQGYVLKSPHILDLMTKKIAGAERLSVSQKLIIFTKNPDNTQVEFAETLKYIFPDKFRSEIVSEHTEKTHVVSDGVSITLADGNIVSESEKLFDLYKDILLYNERELLQKRLYQLGVDVSVSSFGLFKDKTAFVIGAEYPDKSLPQLWIDKETFLPLRWIVKVNTDENSLFEFRYFEWKRTNKVWYPGRIEFYKNSILMRKIDVNSITVNTVFPVELFDIEHIRSLYIHTYSVDSDNKEDGMSEVEKTIEEFNSLFE